MAKKGSTSARSSRGTDLGFEAKLWQAAEKLRGHMHAFEYKQVVLELVLLKYTGAII
ncbi:MAG: type I restriction-modification system subunit M N-terminal domain-containing protein [Acidobacteriia bacterium]|nr:type I restriction-modification system subunit M N-terminal domain-containing protein [Terriglobia bacterium]